MGTEMPGPDLQPYFERIGFEGPASATRDTLTRLHQAHVEAIPFENLTPLMGERVALEPEALLAKLVSAGRGGYCYEHNLLFHDVLTALGFDVTLLSARVVWQQPEDAPPGPRTHTLLKVELPEGTYLADVGFGGLTQTVPLRFALDAPQETTHEPFRILEVAPGIYQIEALVAGTWTRLYRFDLQPQTRIDYELGNHFVATHPSSFFTFWLLGARPFLGGRYAVFNNALTVHRLGAESEKTVFDNVADFRQALEEKLLIRLPAGEGLDAALRRLLEGGVIEMSRPTRP